MGEYPKSALYMIGAVDEAKERAKRSKSTGTDSSQPEPKPKPEVEHAAADTHES